MSHAIHHGYLEKAVAALMEAGGPSSRDGRALVLALDETEAGILEATLSEHGIVGAVCADMQDLCDACKTGADAVIISDRHLPREDWNRLGKMLSQQPAWSDLPLIILADAEAMPDAQDLAPNPFVNALFLERPVGAPSLVSAVRIAFRARRRQYELRDREAVQNPLPAGESSEGKNFAELKKCVEERTRNLEASVQSLEGVLYHVAHDLRAPLRTMQGFTQILLDEYATGLGTDGADMARRISAAATRMDKLIQDLLAYGRLAHTKVSFSKLDLNRQVQGVLKKLAEEIQTRYAIVEVQDNMPPVSADSSVLDLQLTHLIGNALTFVHPQVAPQIRISAERLESGMVRLSIRDNGPGIAPEHHERIFRVFERLHGNNVSTGTGIGLAIVRKGAERMGGATGVESNLGAGSRFWLDLPSATKTNE